MFTFVAKKVVRETLGVLKSMAPLSPRTGFTVMANKE